MSNAGRIAQGGSDGFDKTTGDVQTFVSMFAASPLLFALLFIFLAALTAPLKILNPKTRILR